MGKLGKKKQQIQRRLAAARERKKEVLREVRTRLGTNKSGHSNEKRKRESDIVVPQQKVKKLKGQSSGKDVKLSDRVPKKQPQTKLEEAEDELLQDVDFVKFGERVHAPPKLAKNLRKWGAGQNALECVKTLTSSKESVRKKNKNDHAPQMNALQKHAVEAYRAHQRQKRGKPLTGRANMESLKQLVKAEEERATSAST